MAFFLESTFVGLWVFGWKVLPKRVHLATIWLLSFGSALSAAFIIAANSWMQHPVGYELNAAGDRAQLTSIGAVLLTRYSSGATSTCCSPRLSPHR